MEHLHPTTFSESLKATLNCYQITSIDSLSGPSGYPALAAQMWFKENKQLPPIPPQPMVEIPYFIPNDKSAKRSETMLLGEKIACFIVGGEKRLCLPQILTSVLREYSIMEINQACAELHIYCSRCLPDQLDILKALGILPINTAQCGFVTKSDAERLVALLTDQQQPMKKDKLPKDIHPDSGFPVYHECFGRGYGKFYASAYTSPASNCIMCDDCHRIYSPQRFIAHSERPFEKRTCHWGFDPENWRSYLLLPNNLESPKREEMQKVLDQIKARFDPSLHEAGTLRMIQFTGSKRRHDYEQESANRKKIKEEDGKVFEQGFLPHPYASLPYAVPGLLHHSVFRPWSPGLTITGHSSSDDAVMQDLAHLKGLTRYPIDRRAVIPHFIQTSRPVVLGSGASDFTVPATQPVDARVAAAASVRPFHTNGRKQLSEPEQSVSSKASVESPTARERAANQRDIGSSHQRDHAWPPSATSLSKAELNRTRSFERSPAKRERSRSTSPPPHISNTIEAGPRTRCTVSPHCHLTTSHSNNTKSLKKNEQDISRPVSRSREAAATAMLELKSSGRLRSGAPPLTCPDTGPPALLCHSTITGSFAPKVEPQEHPPSPPKSVSTVIPLDRQHYKWMIEGQSYIVSAAGMQCLEMLRRLVEADCGSESGRGRLMHALVKMKCLHEEKVSMETRVRCDLENEFERFKASNLEKQHQMAESRKLFRQEIECMRHAHTQIMEELERRKKRGDSNSGNGQERESLDLTSRVLQLEMERDKLRLDLIDEKEKRHVTESKLEEAEKARGILSFLTTSPLSRMVRGVGNMDRKTTVAVEYKSSPSHAITSSRVSNTPESNSVSHRQQNGISLPIAMASTAIAAPVYGSPSREQLFSKEDVVAVS